MVNLPLPHLSGAGALEAWVCRATAVVPDGTLPGNTSWAGSAALSDEALAALWFGMRLLRSDTLEDNWGFTWDGDAWATPQGPVHHALLGLAFGSTTVAVYTACTTHNWPAQIAPDPDGLRREGKDPARYEPPYCQGAPPDEYGESRPNAGGVLLLSRFLERFGDELAACHSSPAARLVVDPVTAAEGAWPVGDVSRAVAPGPLGTALAACVRLMIQDGQEVDVVLPDDSDLLDAPGDPASDGVMTPLWVVAGGHVMSRDLQARLAARASAGERVVVVEAVPDHDENGAPCRLLAQAPVTVVAAGSPETLHRTLVGTGPAPSVLTRVRSSASPGRTTRATPGSSSCPTALTDPPRRGVVPPRASSTWTSRRTGGASS
ncbi:hypothetical protein ACFYWH_40140 [Streptomyces sp. NPDC003737]|uniref:hypothetical protein n=1 Tax=Streptomyces sp. NPDC003737 TaxID=3364685 RepID=UPI0036D0ACCB